MLPGIVDQYSDVFPEDLIELPPRREVEFTIDQMPGTMPIWLATYHMTPVEIRELKT